MQTPPVRLSLAPGEMKFCVLDVAGEATASCISRYVTASGYNIVTRGEHPAAEQYRGASLIIADGERLPSLASTGDGPRPILIGVCALGEGHAAGCTGRRWTLCSWRQVGMEARQPRRSAQWS